MASNTRLCLILSLGLIACGENQPASGSDNGGSTASGGKTASGGSVATGGSPSSGGSSKTGGTTSTGGIAQTGGTNSTGGIASTGGVPATGGKSTGGTVSTGGIANTGGTSNTGGNTSTGGTANTGGAANTGGIGATGGTTATGGRTGTGGVANTGGTTGTGGAATGGTTVPSGGTAVVKCTLPAGPDSSVAAPTGSGSTLDVLPWAGFKAATSFSFDDGNKSQIDNYATLNGLGVKLTFYLVTGWASASNAIWKQAIADGHEIGNHTQSHSCGTASAGQSDLKSKLSVTAYTLAAPNGDTACGSSVSSLNLLLNRGVGGGTVAFNAAESVANNLPTNLPPSNASASNLTSAIDSAYSKGVWQTFCIHGFTGDSSAYQAFPLASFTDAVKTEKQKKDLWIDTMQAVGAYWRAGLLFAKATATTSGTEKTWKWTVPAYIPPNTCLRVKSNGGTVKQKGATIPWDSHGYYEISFNAGEVTLASQ